MRAVVQRVKNASVSVDGKLVAAVDGGLLVFLGVTAADGPAEADILASKIARLRIFSDDAGKMNRSLLDIGGASLVISQFTLYADTTRGNRPSFIQAAPPAQGNDLYDLFCFRLEACGVPVGKGIFGAHMEIGLLNDGPVTICLDTDAWRRGDAPKHASV